MSAAGDATAQIETVINSLTEAIKGNLARPVYFVCERDTGGNLSIRQIEFLTTDELAELCKVDVRTVHTWIARKLLPYYKPPGTLGVLFDLNETIEWIGKGRKEAGSDERTEDI